MVVGLNLQKNSTIITEAPTSSTKLLIRTGLLTVWRKLHIEADSMGAVTDNREIGTFNGNQVIAPNGDTTLNLNITPGLEQNRFEEGRLVFLGSIPDPLGGSPTIAPQSLGVVDHYVPRTLANIQTAKTANTVVVTNTTGNTINVTSGESFTLYDDDDFDDDGVRNGDAGEDISIPDLGLLEDSDDM